MIEFGEQVPKIHILCYLLIENIVKSQIMRKLEIPILQYKFMVFTHNFFICF